MQFSNSISDKHHSRKSLIESQQHTINTFTANQVTYHRNENLVSNQSCLHGISHAKREVNSSLFLGQEFDHLGTYCLLLADQEYH